MKKSVRIAVIGKECVACGSCVTVCPKAAIQIVSGVIAQIDKKKCIGCGKCEKLCPAAVIMIRERKVAL